MNIAIIGYGNMGQRIETLAKQRGHNIVAIIDPRNKKATHTTVSEKSLNNADIAIDFSLPESAIKNIKTILPTQTKLIIGTTGWYENLEEIKNLTEKSNNGMLWSSNFSIGVNYYFKIIEKAAQLFNNSDSFDIWGNEIHHNNKVDSPSGTAKTIEDILLKEIKRKTRIVEEKLDRKILPEEIHFSSTRGGAVNFKHTIGFDSEEDCIEIIHSARNRDGYVKGAILAAEWMEGKQGFYSFEDVIF